MADFSGPSGFPSAASPGEPTRPPGIEHLELVAGGGFATVYRGWQPAFNRWVAVKLLTGQHGSSPVYRFDQEARALGSLSEHPHVVPVYQAGEIDGCPYLVMPYLAGGSLQERLVAGPVAAPEAVATGQAVADALAEAHRRGILHRDIKPANILFTAFGVPQLADFGVARLSDSTLTGGLLAVTVSYAAPEVLSGERATPLSDVYSLGATLYAALRGAPPFAGLDGEVAVAQAMRVVNEQPAPLASSGVAGPIVEVVERAMAKDPGQRYASAAEFRDALARLQPVAGPRDAEPGAAGGASRRRRRVLVALATTLALAGAATGIGLSALGGSHTPGHTAAATGHAPMGASASVPAHRPATTPTTARASGSTASGDAPPSAGGATSPADIPSSTLADTLRAYYALVDQHRLAQSWQWLSPDFQDRIGQAYYQQFWDSISQVQILSVQVTGGVAALTLRYSSAQGGTSVESADLGFAIGDGRILIDSDQVTHG